MCDFPGSFFHTLSSPDRKNHLITNKLKTQFFFSASSSIHCLATLDLGASVEQPFDRFIVQNRQVMCRP